MKKLTITTEPPTEIWTAIEIAKLDSPQFARLYVKGSPTNEIFVISFDHFVQLNGTRFWHEPSHVGSEYTFELLDTTVKI